MSDTNTGAWCHEMFGDEGGSDPYWVSAETEQGERDAVEAATLVRSFAGSFDDHLSVERVRGRIEHLGSDGYFFHKDDDGEHPFWEVCGA